MAQCTRHAQAMVQGLGGIAKAGNGRYQEWHREGGGGSPYFRKLGGGAFIYRVASRRSCMGLRCLDRARVVHPTRPQAGARALTSLSQSMPNLSDALTVEGCGVSKSMTAPLPNSSNAEASEWQPVWCISPVLDAVDGVWAVSACQDAALAAKNWEDWEINLAVASGRPKVMVMRALVHIARAMNLRASDINGLSDPYCICQVHGKPDLTFKTAVEPASLNPIWNCWHELDGVEIGDTIEFTCMDWDAHSEDELLGSAFLVVRPGGWKGELQLKLGGMRKAGSVRLEVIIPPPVPQQRTITRKVCARPGDPASKLLMLVSAGGVEAVQAAAVIESAAQDENRRSELFMAGAVQPMVKLLSGPSPEGKQRAAGALANLACLHPCRKAITSSGAIPALVAVLADSSIGAKAEAARALEQLAVSDKVRMSMASAGAVRHTMTLLSSNEAPGVERAASLLACLALHSGVAEIIADSGAARVLVGHLSSGSVNERRCAVAALQNMVTCTAGKQAALDAGFLASLAELLRSGPVECRAEAANATAALVGIPSRQDEDEGEGQARAQLVEALVKAGVVQSLVNLMSKYGHHIKAALGALCRMASLQCSFKVMLSSGVLPCLLALQSPGYDASTQARAAEMLQILASSNKHNREAMEAAVPRGRSRDLLTKVLEASPEWHATISLTSKPGTPAAAQRTYAQLVIGGGVVSASWKAEVKQHLQALEAKVACIRQSNPDFLVTGTHIAWPPPGEITSVTAAASRQHPAQRIRPQSAGSLLNRRTSQGGCMARKDGEKLLPQRPQSAGARFRSTPSQGAIAPFGSAPAKGSAAAKNILGRRISDRGEALSNRPRPPPRQEALIAIMVPVCHHEANLKAAHDQQTWAE